MVLRCKQVKFIYVTDKDLESAVHKKSKIKRPLCAIIAHDKIQVTI